MSAQQSTSGCVPVHPRVSLHQVAFARDGTPAYFEFCRTYGIGNMTFVPLLMAGENDVEIIRRAPAEGGPKAKILNHQFGVYPNLQLDTGTAPEKLLEAIDVAASLSVDAIYMQTGGRESLDWEQAAERFIRLLAPCKAAARAKGVALMIENASPLNIDIHIAHTLADTILLAEMAEMAEMAEIGVCIDLQPCWGEAGLDSLFRRAMPITKLVQVSDYVLGDRVAPCRAVPGDGVVPLERLIGCLLDAGYQGLFDLELVGPRIEAEGAAAASMRAIKWLSERLDALGA